MKTKDILERINQMEHDLTEIYKVADAKQIAKIIEVMEKYNQHPKIINYLKWQVGLLIGVALIGLIGLVVAISLCTRL